MFQHLQVFTIYLFGLSLIFLSAQPARSHESRPLYIEIEEQASGVFSVQWKTPPSVSEFNRPSIAYPESCNAIGPMRLIDNLTNIIKKQEIECSNGVSGQSFGIMYPKFNPSVTTLLRVTWVSGEIQSILASPEEKFITIPEKETPGGIANEYMQLGIRHILEGYDHLLFLACLLFIAGTGRRILIAITGFTLAHSLTLALSALDIIRVSVAPIEAAIALSIVFLATEIARGRRDSLTYRYPIAVSSSFGLLHGFGFATVLRDIGLPQTELVSGLLFFNVGVEIGQILFVVCVILFYRATLILGSRFRGRTIMDLTMLKQPATYVVGSLASYWMIERIAGFWV